MKNISYAINGVLAVAIIVLFILFFTSNKKNADDAAKPNFADGDSASTLPVAYVNMDSLLRNYNFAKDANDKLMKKYNSSNSTLQNKQRQFQNEVADFQRKAQNNAFLSRERAEQEQARLQKMEQDLHRTAQKLEEEYIVEQNNMNAQVTDSVRTSLKVYNKTAKYHIIFNNVGLDNVLLANESYDITNDVVKLLNSRYKPEPAK